RGGDGRWVEGDVAARLGVVVDDDLGDDAEVLDASGLLVAPGAIDLQCNGGLGIDLSATPERLWDLAAELPRFGVTAWLPTIVTSPEGTVDRALAALAAGPPEGWRGAIPVGLHLEGPFLSEAKKGAHRAEHLQPPTLDAVDGWSREAGVALVTLAPDLPGAHEVIAALVERGIVVSAGHTPATAAEATEAVDAGVRWVTHLFNAMAPVHHREPGLAGVALSDPRLHVGLIPDGVHVHPAAVALAQAALRDRLTIVTDAVAALGQPPGTYGPVTVDATSVRLADGTLAGSNLAMDQAIRNLVAFSGCSAAEALAAASANPARLLHDGLRGVVAPGARADLVLLTPDLHLVATIVGGRVGHDAR
ncbi:MAG: N-acetylglucosamine-6-phosphate deacetylase, partial [Acidimicrobiales bacterium]